MENNIFRGNGFPIIEMQVLPSFYEGPPHTTNVTVRNNSFGVGKAFANTSTSRIGSVARSQCCAVVLGGTNPSTFVPASDTVPCLLLLIGPAAASR